MINHESESLFCCQYLMTLCSLHRSSTPADVKSPSCPQGWLGLSLQSPGLGFGGKFRKCVTHSIEGGGSPDASMCVSCHKAARANTCENLGVSCDLKYEGY